MKRIPATLLLLTVSVFAHPFQTSACTTGGLREVDGVDAEGIQDSGERGYR
jgi:hypothetical protein